MTKSKPCSNGRCVQGLAKCVVARRQDFLCAGDGRNALEIDDFEHRIGRRLEPHQARVRTYRAIERFGIGKIDVGRLDPGRLAAYQIEKSSRAAINVIADHHVRIFFEAVEHGRGCRHAGGEGETRATTFEIGDAALERHARRVLTPRVFKTFVDPGAGLRKSGCRIDRRHYGAGRGVILLAGMHATRGEAEGIAVCHRH